MFFCLRIWFSKRLIVRGKLRLIYEIVKYAFHYNDDCLFEKLIHYFWRHTISNFAHFSSKCIYIIMVERGRINIMQKFFKILKYIVIYIILQLQSHNLLLNGYETPKEQDNSEIKL